MSNWNERESGLAQVSSLTELADPPTDRGGIAQWAPARGSGGGDGHAGIRPAGQGRRLTPRAFAAWAMNRRPSAFLDHAATDRLGARFETMAAAGLRRGEACGLRWADVDLERARLVVRQQLVQLAARDAPDEPSPTCQRAHRGLSFGPPKTASGEARVVDLDQGPIGILLGHRLAQDDERTVRREAYADHGLVFCRENGDPLPLEAVTRRFGELCRSAGVRRARLHDLRHGAASLRLAAGVDLAVVSKQLGHSSIGITADTYSHLLEGVGREVAERAAALVPRTPRDHSVTTPPDPAG